MGGEKIHHLSRPFAGAAAGEKQAKRLPRKGYMDFAL